MRTLWCTNPRASKWNFCARICAQKCIKTLLRGNIRRMHHAWHKLVRQKFILSTTLLVTKYDPARCVFTHFCLNQRYRIRQFLGVFNKSVKDDTVIFFINWANDCMIWGARKHFRRNHKVSWFVTNHKKKYVASLNIFLLKKKHLPLLRESSEW